MTRSRVVGTKGESRLVEYLRAHGFPFAERKSLHGGKDEGDVTGCPGIVWEMKSVVRSGYEIPAWLKELDAEMVNAGVGLGVLVVKPKGVAEPGGYWAVMHLEQACRLLAENRRWNDYLQPELRPVVTDVPAGAL